jgi:uncharacterized protein (DUF427 family)
MASREIRQPGPDHPITIEPYAARVVVSVAGRVVADTRHALTLREADYRPVQYIPMADVDQTLLAPSAHTSYCPFKGEAGYYSVPLGGEPAVNAVWFYEHPYEAVGAIEGHVAFYPDRVESIVEQPAD